jgi:GNAT superfamily N-acetyltransferase
MTPLTLRSARLSDAQALAVLHVATWQHAYRGLLPDDFLDGLSLQSSIDRWQLALVDPHRHVWVACEAGRIVGFVSLGGSRDDDATPGLTGEVYAMYVHPSAWQHGVGSALMARALDELAALGCVEATLWVLRHNQRARAFYEARGFVADGGAKVDVNAVGIEYDDVRYRRRLSCHTAGESGMS